MFTGLVECMGEVSGVADSPPGKVLEIRCPDETWRPAVGDSIAINGCCLTVIAADARAMSFEAGPETLARTNLGLLAAGNQANLERSLQVGDRLGGHLVTGHIDAVGKLALREDDREWSTFWFEIPPALAPQLASKGSIAIDGVSLTLVEVADHRFSVALIPHTLSVTTLGRLSQGDSVNLETDLLAKYVARQLQYLGSDANA